VIAEVGRGGMATVYLARQNELNREVALKELSSFCSADSSVVDRFLRESQLAGSLNHPNIVTVHQFFEFDGVPYIGMQYFPADRCVRTRERCLSRSSSASWREFSPG